MADRPRLLKAADLDAMTPNERAAAFDERIVTDLDDLPPSFREKVLTTGRRMARRLDTTTGE